MPVPTLVTDLSTTLASNSPAGSDNVFPDLDNYLRAMSGFIASIRDNSGNGWVSPYLPLTYSAGTANGVVYLNGSKVVTTGSALTFDGTNFSTTGTATATKLIPTGGSATGNGMYLPAANTLGFSTNGTQAMTLDASGNLLVGTTSTGGVGISIYNQANNSNIGRIDFNKSYDGAATVQGFYYNGTGIGTISCSNTATAYNTSSDYRLKDNPQPLTGSGAFIDSLQPKTWNWKADGTRGVGFIAHEAQAVSPTSVTGTKDAVDAEGKPVMQAMEYGSAEFIANIIAELKSLRARVAALEAA